MRTISPIGNKRAVTLIEVMIAVVILTVGIIGVIQAYIKSLSVLQISKDYLVQAPWVENKITALEMQAFEQGGLSQGKESGSFQSAFVDFNWETEISPSDIQGLNTLKVRCFNAHTETLRDFALISYVSNKK